MLQNEAEAVHPRKRNDIISAKVLAACDEFTASRSAIFSNEKRRFVLDSSRTALLATSEYSFAESSS